MASDYTTTVLGALFALSAAATAGIAQVSILGTSITDTLYVIPYGGGYEVAYSTAVSVGTFLGAWYIEQADWSRMQGEQRGLVGLTLALIAAGVLFPDYASEIGTEIAVVVLGIMTGGYWAVAHQ